MKQFEQKRICWFLTKVSKKIYNELELSDALSYISLLAMCQM